MEYYNDIHDEFVSNNMTVEGYKKMYQAVCKYIKKYNTSYHYDGEIREMTHSENVSMKIVRWGKWKIYYSRLYGPWKKWKECDLNE